MIILALDPGSTSSGWCAIDTRGGGGAAPITSTFLEAGNVPSEAGAIAKLIREQNPDLVAVEALAGHAYGSKPGVVAALLTSARAAGIVVAVAWAEGRRPVVEMTAREWRKLVLGNGAATDQRIAQVVPSLVHGWPKRSNVHERDAGGLALGVAWNLNGRVPRPLDDRGSVTQ